MSIFYLIYIEFMIRINAPHWLIFALWHLISFIFIAILLVITVIILVLFERKYLAFYTRRKGPNRVGTYGCLQTIADAIKLLFKENIEPKNIDKMIYYTAPLLVFSPIMTVWFLIPFTSGIIPFDSSCSLLLFMAILSIPILATLFAGFSSGNKYSLIGGLRACTQAISSEIPLFLCLISISILSGSMNLDSIVKMQNDSIFQWYIFPNILGFIIFFISALIVMNRTPFDLPEAESELTAGYHSEYSGMKFAMFFLGEYALTFILSAFIATLFLGGYNSPMGFYISDLLNLPIIFQEFLKNIEQFIWLMLKTVILILIIMWIRASYPRLTTEKTLIFSWYILTPLAIFNIFIMAIYKLLRSIL